MRLLVGDRTTVYMYLSDAAQKKGPILGLNIVLLAVLKLFQAMGTKMKCQTETKLHSLSRLNVYRFN